MKKIFLIIILFCFCGCDKFLDVKPDNIVFDTELFTKRSGFEAALANIYLGLTDNALYGRELKYGFVESMVGSYINPSQSHAYYYPSIYNFEESSSQNYINNIWSRSYSLIAQCNNILLNVDNIRDDPYYDIVKGEALGLRSFLHFQLLKLFGPVISQEGLSAQAIPYFEKLSYTSTKFSSAEDVINFLLRDLNEAEVALQNDPIMNVTRTTNLNADPFEPYNSLIDTRGDRMNYYGVRGLKAMVYQWKGDLENAALEAQTLINAVKAGPTFRLAGKGDLTDALALNRRMSTEFLFGLYQVDLVSKVTPVLPLIASLINTVSAQNVYPNYTWLNTNLYSSSVHGSTNDFRLLYWFAYNITWKLIKYETTNFYSVSNQNAYLYEFKLIGLHDIYMIAAESIVDSDPAEALRLLNEIRNARGLGNLALGTLTSVQIKEYIFAENRKENIAEGTLYTTYKRLFRNIDKSPTSVTARIEIFKFPIPPLELQYNPN